MASPPPSSSTESGTGQGLIPSSPHLAQRKNAGPVLNEVYSLTFGHDILKLGRPVKFAAVSGERKLHGQHYERSVLHPIWWEKKRKKKQPYRNAPVKLCFSHRITGR